MARIKARRYGRDAESVSTGATTGIIKIGWKGKSGQGKDIPTKLGGFLITHDTLDGDNRPLIDFDAMARLGLSEAEVRDALRNGFKHDGRNFSFCRHVVISDKHCVTVFVTDYNSGQAVFCKILQYF